MKITNVLKSATLHVSAIIVSTSLIGTMAFAQSGGAGDGGGNLGSIFDREEEIYTSTPEQIALRKNEENLKNQMRAQSKSEVKEFIKTKMLQKNLLLALRNQVLLNSLEPNYQKLIATLIKKGLIQDIETANFKFQKNCVDSRTQKQRSLSTAIGNMTTPLIGASICVDLDYFTNDYIRTAKIKKTTVPVWLLVGLFLHDYARHFGVADDNHDLALKFSQAYFKYGAQIVKEKVLLPIESNYSNEESNLYGVILLRALTSNDRTSNTPGTQATLDWSGTSDAFRGFANNSCDPLSAKFGKKFWSHYVSADSAYNGNFDFMTQLTCFSNGSNNESVSLNGTSIVVDVNNDSNSIVLETVVMGTSFNVLHKDACQFDGVINSAIF